MNAISAKAKKELAAQRKDADVRRERANCINYGICPDCGEKLQRGEENVGWLKRLWYPSVTFSCKTHGVMDRTWYTTYYDVG